MHRHLLSFILLLAMPAFLSADDKPPKKALCPVCAVKGEREEERVKAHAEHDGDTYYFCSKDCRAAFEQDPVAYMPPEFPRPAPPATVLTLEGETVDLSRYKGRVVVLDFWASWCAPCIDMMPKLQALQDAHPQTDLVVLGVSIDEGEDRIRKIRRSVDRVGASYAVFSDAADVPAWHVFGVKAIPAMFLIDQQGQIVAQWLGRLSQEELTREVARLLQPDDKPRDEG